MAIVIGAGVVAGGALGGAVLQGNAAKSAAQTQANSAQNATNAELSMFGTTQKNLAPYMGAGTNALSALDFGLGIGPNKGGGPPGMTYGGLMKPFTASQYQQSPGYAWQMSQGIDAVQNSAAAAGGIGGGNTLKALTTYGQGLANTDYQQALQNYMAQQQQSYSMLGQTANAGQNAAAGLGGISAQVGGQVGGNIIGAGNAQAAGTIGQANAIGGGINSLAQLSALYGSGSMGSGGGPGINNPYSGVGTEGFQNTYYPSQGLIPGYSDYALKESVVPYLFDGQAQLTVYEFRYKSDPVDAPKRLGFIAQEAREKYPAAVSRGPSGYLRVDYSRIPTQEDWTALDKNSHEARL